MKRFLVFPAIFLAALASPAFAGPGFDVGARGYYWFPDLTAEVKTTANGITGEFNAQDDLGVDDENIPAGEAFIRIGRAHLRVGYMPVSFEGNRVVRRDITFNGRTFAAGTAVASNLDLKMTDVDLQFDILRPDAGVADFNLGLIIKVKYVDGNVELRSATQVEEKDFKAPIPMAGLGAGVGLFKSFVRADVRAAGIGYSGNHLFDGDAFVSISPLPFISIQGGYRYIDFKIDEDDIVAKVKLKGPYVGAQLSF